MSCTRKIWKTIVHSVRMYFLCVLQSGSCFARSDRSKVDRREYRSKTTGDRARTRGTTRRSCAVTHSDLERNKHTYHRGKAARSMSDIVVVSGVRNDTPVYDRIRGRPIKLARYRGSTAVNVSRGSANNTDDHDFLPKKK